MTTLDIAMHEIKIDNSPRYIDPTLRVRNEVIPMMIAADAANVGSTSKVIEMNGPPGIMRIAPPPKAIANSPRASIHQNRL